VNGKITVTLSHCDACEAGRHTRAPFTKDMIGTRATTVNELVHTNVAKPLPVPTHAGNRYYVSFVDDVTRFGTLNLLEAKHVVLDKLKDYKAVAETSHPGQPLQRVRADNAGENTSTAFRDFMRGHGLRYKLTTADTGQQNGVAERYNRTIFEKVRAQHARCRRHGQPPAQH
jgi:transposase InsO family protein